MRRKPDRCSCAHVLARLALVVAGCGLPATPSLAQDEREQVERELPVIERPSSHPDEGVSRPRETPRSHGEHRPRHPGFHFQPHAPQRDDGGDEDEPGARPPDDQSGLQAAIIALGRRDDPPLPTPVSSPSATPAPAATVPVPGLTPHSQPRLEETDGPRDGPETNVPAPEETDESAPYFEDSSITQGHVTATDKETFGDLRESGGSGWLPQVLAGLAATLALGIPLLATRPRPGQAPTPVHSAPEEKPPVIYGEEIADPTHHCRGHRLAIVVGSRGDPSITMARSWVNGLGNVQHKLYIETLRGGQPDMGSLHSSMADLSAPLNNPTSGESRPRSMRDAIKGYFDRHAKCCCHWDEVILVMHGHTKYKWHWLLKNLTNLIDDRPLGRFVLWMCGSADQFYPDHKIKVEGLGDDGKLQQFGATPGARKTTSQSANVFEQIAWLLRPKSCHVEEHCGCTTDHCTAFNADGRRNGQCPDGSQSVTLLCSSWTRGPLIDAPSNLRKAAASLGIEPPDGARPVVLTAPEGRLRSIAIGSDGSVASTDLENAAGMDVFAGTRLKKTDAPGIRNEDVIRNFDKFLRPTRIEQPGDLPEAATYSGGKYQGPNGCQEGKEPQVM